MEQRDEPATTPDLPLDQQAASMLMAGRSQAQTAAELEAQGVPRVDARHVTETVYCEIASHLERERPDAASLSRAVAGAAAAAAVGAVAWGVIVWKWQFEWGLFAWGIGLLVGWAVLAASGHRKGRQLQVIAVAGSLVGIVLGKYLAVYFTVLDESPSIGVFDPALVRLFLDNLGQLFTMFDLLFVGFAVFTAWRMLEPTQAAIQRAQQQPPQFQPGPPR